MRRGIVEIVLSLTAGFALLGGLGISAAAAPAQDPAEPQPQEAVRAILSAFDQFPVVALGMSHWQETEADFSLAVIRDPAFSATVNDIVLECGNALYQDVLDHYVSGDSVPAASLQRVWQNTTQPGRGDSRHPKELIDAVREINKGLPATRKIRVLAGDSPIDWEKIQKPEDIEPFESRRDEDFASVVEREVLSKRRKALLVIGAAHVFRHPVSWRNVSPPPAPTVTMIVERDFPGSMFVIMPHDGFGERLHEFEARFAAWPNPALLTLKTSWLGSVQAGLVFAGNIRRVGSDPHQVDDPYPGFQLHDLADAFLYMGPLASLTRVEFFSPEPGSAYEAELNRRHRLMGEEPPRSLGQAGVVAVPAAPVTSARAPGSVFRDCPDCPEMVVIPAGRFTMGSSAAEKSWAAHHGAKPEWVADESPQHEVSVKGFAMGTYDVTRAEYEAFIRETGHPAGGGCYDNGNPDARLHEGANWQAPGFSQTDHDPVVCVSWEDAHAYLYWLNHKLSGSGDGPYRLPSEAEWEYAARGGTTTRFWWGDEDSIATHYAWYQDNSNGKTHPVGSKPANPFGLYDIVGNVWQWTEDCYAKSYDHATSDGSATASDAGCLRSDRGGSWFYPSWLLRPATRERNRTDYRDKVMGFRLARTLP